MLHLPTPNPLALPHVFACWNRDEAIRFQSASGGAFSALADQILGSGGVVFGAAFDEEMCVKHIAVQREEDLGRLRGSKYVQSDIARSYVEVRDFLRQDRSVLFSGTPCQIAGLTAFIGKENTNLFTCDLLCYGVPSPRLFAKYIDWLGKLFSARVVSMNFRDKRKSWEEPSTVAVLEDGRECLLTGYSDSFRYGFAKGLTLRPVCYRCPYTSFSRVGDVTLGDFWGLGEVAPFRHSKRNGISLILVNSEKGRRLLMDSSSELFMEERTMQEAACRQVVVRRPHVSPGDRPRFFYDYRRGEYARLAKRHLVDRGARGLVKRFVPRAWISYLRKCVGMG
jgi:coenzyme F420-reducing hydrogenase beta subunit